MLRQMFGYLIILVLFTSSVSPQVNKTVYISLVKKGNFNSYFNLLSTQKYQVVASQIANNQALKYKKVKINNKETLAFIELQDSYPLTENKNILFKFDQIAIKKINIKDRFKYKGHLYSQPHLYSEVLNTNLKFKIQSKKNISINSKKNNFNSSIDLDFMKNKLEEFSGNVDVVINGETKRIDQRGSLQGRKLARDYLKAEFEKIGFEVDEHNYGRGVNFIAEKKGLNAEQYLILSAHYDSVHNSGADDDASGVISALAIAKSLSESNLEYSLRIVSFDEEEVGLVGSKRYAKMLNENDFQGMIGVVNIEMTGYDADNDGVYHVIDCNENSSAELSDVLEQVILENNINLEKKSACANRSDHASFWRYDQPAVVISQNFFGGDSNPCYHKSCDKFDKINFEYMYKLTSAINLMVARITGAN